MSGGDVCWRCGTSEADTWRFCPIKKEFVCLNCERSCPSYSRAMLPNGTNCWALYAKDATARKILNRRFPANSGAVAEARKYWQRRRPETLSEILAKAVEKHDASDDAEYRANVRAHISALQELIKEGQVN